MSMPASSMFASSVRRISPVPPPNRVWNAAEVLVDGWKASENFFSIHVDFLNRLFGIADGIEQVLALSAEEFLALAASWNSSMAVSIHRPQRLDASPVLHRRDSSASAMAFGVRGPFRHRLPVLSTAQFNSLRLVSSRILQLRLPPDQVHFDLRAVVVGLFHFQAKLLQVLFGGNRSSRICASSATKRLTAASVLQGLLGQRRQLFVQLDVVGKQPRIKLYNFLLRSQITLYNLAP